MIGTRCSAWGILGLAGTWSSKWVGATVPPLAPLLLLRRLRGVGCNNDLSVRLPCLDRLGYRPSVDGVLRVGGSGFVPCRGLPPRTADLKRTFVVRFVAQLPSDRLGGNTYSVFMPSPSRCSNLLAESPGGSFRYRPGDRVGIALSAAESARWTPVASRPRLCVGRYTGGLYYWRNGAPPAYPRFSDEGAVRISNIDFTVKRNARPQRGFSLYPRVGGPRETFVIRLRAPFAARDRRGEREAYQLRISEPPACPDLDGLLRDVPGRGYRPGEPVVFALTPHEIGRPARWCAGRYRADVLHVVRTLTGEVLRQRRVGPRRSSSA